MQPDIPSLLTQLLSSDVFNENSCILQCFKYIVDEGLIPVPGDMKPGQKPEEKEAKDQLMNQSRAVLLDLLAIRRIQIRQIQVHQIHQTLQVLQVQVLQVQVLQVQVLQILQILQLSLTVNRILLNNLLQTS